MKDIQLLITVTRRADALRYTEFFAKHGTPVIYGVPAHGTATAKTLDLFGLEQTEKSVLFSVMPGEQVRSLMASLVNDMYIDLPDQGIAVSVPLSTMGGKSAFAHFMPGVEPADNASEVNKMNDTNLELIIAIAEKGQTDLVMDAARAGGARGGTVLHAKGTAGVGSNSFFGVSIAEEKEMIFIVADGETKRDIMRAIMQQAGANTDARAVVFSLPVSEACGFRYGKQA